MNNNLESLFFKYEELLSSQRFIESDLDYSILERHIPQLEALYELTNSVIFVFDLFKKKHVYISKNISTILNLSSEKALIENGYIDHRIHKDDLFNLMESGIYFLSYGISLLPQNRKDNKLVNEYRILKDDGQYLRVVEQQMCLESDSNGNIWLALGIMDISPDQNSTFKSRLMDIKKGEVFLFPPPNKEVVITTREREILLLISKGYKSKQIAEKLFISTNTVNTHRQKILTKLNAENAIEAIKYATILGLI